MDGRTPIGVLGLCFLLCLSAGCASSRTIRAKIESIRDKHGVTVRADNPLSRCYLFGNLPGLLDRIDKSLDGTPQFFKDNLGPVIVEESFADNLATYPFPFLVRGYVAAREEEEGFPIHIKNRSLLEKVLVFAARDGELFLHEASHSFEFNVYTNHSDLWVSFYEEFDGAGGLSYLPSYAGPILYSTLLTACPPLTYLRIGSMPSLYGWLNHFEDFAETHCYMARYGGDVEFLRQSDLALFKKCKAVERLLSGGVGGEIAEVRESPRGPATM